MRTALRLPTLVFVAIVLVALTSYLKSPDSALRPQVQLDIKNIPAPELSEAYERERQRYVTIVTKENAGTALDTLQQNIRTSPLVSYFCHELAHQIGLSAYEKDKSFAKAASYQNEICVSGYIHGVMEGLFGGAADVAQAAESMGQKCSKLPNSSYSYWECYHGIGHGLMFYLKNELPDAVAECEKYPDAGARDGCTNGAYMENFNSDQKVHLSRFLKPEDMFYPCQDQKEAYKFGCYMNAPIYYLNRTKNDFRAALDWCEAAEKNYINACSYGVGAQTLRRNPLDIHFAEALCNSDDLEKRGSCIRGMLSMYISHYALRGVAVKQKVCGALSHENKAICQNAIENLLLPS